MGLTGLAEGIILQSIEDLWDDNLREGSIAFFNGQDFRVCADLAGMKLSDQVKLLGYVKDAMDSEGKKAILRRKSGGGAKMQHKWLKAQLRAPNEF